MKIFTEEQFESWGYTKQNNGDYLLLCWGNPVSVSECEKSCQKYSRCQNIADLDDAIKLVDGEFDFEEDYYDAIAVFEGPVVAGIARDEDWFNSN